LVPILEIANPRSYIAAWQYWGAKIMRNERRDSLRSKEDGQIGRQHRTLETSRMLHPQLQNRSKRGPPNRDKTPHA
jgi:hypothetical protein